MANLNRTLGGFRFVQIEQDDTLQAIAARELEDASRWADLITINGLKFPYITGDHSKASASVKLYGDLLVVPAATIRISATTDPDLVFGMDMLLDGNGMLSDNGSGDFAVVSGRDNLKQALSNVVNTIKGELLFHLGYGCEVRKLIGSVNRPTAALLAAEDIKLALLADDRVQAVRNSRVTVEGDALVASASVAPIAGAVIDISARP